MNKSDIVHPFSCSYSPNVPELLTKLNCTLAISTYQAGKVIFISPKDEEQLVQLPRTFDKPMGIAYNAEKEKMGIACRSTVEIFQNSESLAAHYPRSKNKYDALFMPRSTFYTGHTDIHDLSFGVNDRVFGVNTLFSCVVEVTDSHNFTPYWQPQFISNLSAEDRCHLNGMAMVNGLPKYATMFNQGDSRQSWRENITSTGTIIDIETNEVIVDNLGMPHSPTMINGKLYVLLSATGKLVEVDVNKKQTTEVADLNGFVRGMGRIDDYLFIGLSKLRKNSSTFAKLEIADKANHSGIGIIHLPTGSFCGEIKYHASVDEIYDIEVIPNKKRPNIITSNMAESRMGISIPGKTFWAPPSKEEDKKF